MQLKRFQPFSDNKKLRYAAIGLTSLALVLMIVAERIGWIGESRADIVINCPALDQGCNFTLNGKPVKIKSDIPLEAGKPFVLDVDGKAAGARALWRMVDMDMGPNNYWLLPSNDGHWQAKTTLPPCPQGGKDWKLRLELNSRAVEINTKTK
ncbi:MAG: hypothetical protein P4L87_06050 [Formivibrio sp.]|nr:hypothetical protein [Formivibrio sp.]